MTTASELECDLGATVEARITALLGELGNGALARTIVDHPDVTLRPKEHASASSRGLLAVRGLRELAGGAFAKMEVHETLGEGGMGVVHLATQATVGRHVAIKRLRSGITTDDAALRILREAWVTGTLEHPNVVPIYDVGVDDAGFPIIVMKRIEGKEWANLVHAHDDIKRRFAGQDPHDWNLSILASVCNAVHFAHSRGILHRDLKPENVMIGAFGEVYVLDWGIAVSLTDDGTGRLPLASQATDAAGTPHYMAPEMLLGDPSKLSPRTDVYLLGAILYEIFAGKPPHEGDSLNALVTDILTSPLRFADGFPDEVKAICGKAMDRDPSARYESAEALRQAIVEYVRHRGSRRLASEARESHALLLDKLAEPRLSLGDAKGRDARAQEVGRLLGECRFGYRAALTAWPGNEDARTGLDSALLAVILYSLHEGDTVTCETLLDEVCVKPPELVQHVEEAVRARAAHDDRLHKLETDLDATIGSRTRSLLAVAFGLTWTASPLLAWLYAARTGDEPRFLPAFAPFAFLVLGLAAFRWAKDTLTKTMLNRRLAATLAVYLVAQTILSVGALFADIPSTQVHLLSIFGWALTYALLAVWAERMFAFVAVTCTVSFLLAALYPHYVFAFMSVDNLVFTLVVASVWVPKEDVARFRERGRHLLG